MCFERSAHTFRRMESGNSELAITVKTTSSNKAEGAPSGASSAMLQVVDILAVVV
jgi:hypothetical protein